MDRSTLPSEMPATGEVVPAFTRQDDLACDAAPSFLLKDATSLTPADFEPVLAPADDGFAQSGHEGWKRAFDVAFAVTLILFLAPLAAVCVLAVRLSGPGPVLFRHVRIGLSGQQFQCFKFRTMKQSAEQSLDGVLLGSVSSREEWLLYHKIKQDPRTTRVGRFMRRYSLDEIPQLINVLRGEMSIVGPRPIVHAEIPRYGADFLHYCSVKPGLTGLWQVSGRHALSYEERVMLDARYATSRSLLGDLIILLRTVPVVFLGQNQ
jgi:lipopolysaccharide/colanic/teichoic acid biosynthesis glycosyltransferase